MYENNYIFPAIIEQLGEGDFNVTFPDFASVITYGETLAEAIDMAEDALSGEIYDLFADKLEIPSPTDIKDINLDGKQVLIVVKINLKDILKKYDSKAVKKTLTIPSWLDKLAVEEKVNFSQILQDALKEKLGMSIK